MGVDCHGQLVVGCRFGELFTKTAGTKTKYHEDTGRPYEVAVDKWLLCGQPLKDGQEPHDVLPECLQVYDNGNLVGVLAAETESHRSGKRGAVKLTVDELVAAFSQAEPLFETIGYKGKLSIYLTLSVG